MQNAQNFTVHYQKIKHKRSKIELDRPTMILINYYLYILFCYLRIETNNNDPDILGKTFLRVVGPETFNFSSFMEHQTLLFSHISTASKKWKTNWWFQSKNKSTILALIVRSFPIYSDLTSQKRQGFKQKSTKEKITGNYNISLKIISNLENIALTTLFS